MGPHQVIRVNPTEATAKPGRQLRFQFMPIRADGVAYGVQCDESAVRTWCRLLLPAAGPNPGELVVDVPPDASDGHYVLRLVATGRGQELATSSVTLHVQGDRCLRFGSPTFDLQPDGTVLMTLKVVNCGAIDVNLHLRARHEGGWSFAVDPPELTIGVDGGPVTVKVTLRPPEGWKVDRGDHISVEVEAGSGWQPLRARWPRRVWPWVAAAAVVAAATIGALLASSTDDGTDVGPPPSPPGPGTSVVGPGGTDDGPAELIEVPDVVGRTADDADGTLRGAGFEVATEEGMADQVEPGVVIDQDPAAGSRAEPGTTVTIVIATGPVVPDLVGQHEVIAIDILEEEGFEVLDVVDEESEQVPVGIVLRTMPAGGTKVAPGSGVTLVVSSGPPPTPTTEDPTGGVD